MGYRYTGDQARLSGCVRLIGPGSVTTTVVLPQCKNGECPGKIDGTCPFNVWGLKPEFVNDFR